MFFVRIIFALIIFGGFAIAQTDHSKRLNYHRATNRSSPAPEPGAEQEVIPSLIEGLTSADDWWKVRRPELLRLWTTVLGKIGPNEQDRQWFGDISQAVVHEITDRGSYTRIALDLPIEKDFLQPHLLLLPKNQGPGPFPAVVCWTSTTPDYTEPEKWWGKWLVEHGYVVLTGWSFIRHYRDDATGRNGAPEKLRDRFGHWLPISKMVHDAQREAEYLRSRKEVDASRIGFMGFSLSGKAALYIAAFAPEFKATVAVDPHIAVNGGTNWYAPWYLDWMHPYADIPTAEHTVLSVLNSDPKRPGFEHDHHEILALAAPRPLLIIGGAANSEDAGGDSDDRQSWGYYNRAKEVYRLLGAPDNLRFVLTDNGHHATGPDVDPEWRAFLDLHLNPKPAPLAQTYLRYLQEGIARVEARLASRPDAGLKELESEPGWRHFPSAMLPAAVLAKKAPGVEERTATLRIAQQIGDLLVREHASGYYASRLDHHRDTYMWLEAFRLVRADLDEARRAAWSKALMEEMVPMAADVARLQDYPRYQSPFIGTSPNHYALWSSTLLLAGQLFERPEWDQLARKVLHRFAAEEQAPDGYWGEHSSAGPTTGYDYLTMTAVALYWELTHDPAGLEALRRSLIFHQNFTWPDGTPVETVNDRNRYWPPSMWGHFGFSNLEEGRRYCAFLTGFYSRQPFSLENLGRLAQNFLYYHDGPSRAIPQDRPDYVYRMQVPAMMRKAAGWTACLSAILSTQAQTNQFYLDRQAHLSIFHEQLGLIVTGANSKRQPALGTFTERFGETENALPVSSRLDTSEKGDRLALAYNSFFAELNLQPATARSFAFEVAIMPRSRAGTRQMALQLCLKPGQFIETQAGISVLLGDGELRLTPDQVGTWIRHNAWTMHVPAGTRLEWPVYPFSPYANAPETTLEHAVGLLTRALTGERETLSYRLELAPPH